MAAASAGFLIAKAATWSFDGFAWIGNNLQNGVEQGDPVIGMVSMKGNFYDVRIEGEGDQRDLTGSAWFGIGTQDDKFNEFSNQNDLPSIGWVHFNQPFEQTKLAAILGKNCYGAGDCHGVRWNKKPGGTEAEGFLSGWAVLELGPNGDTTPYPDVLVHFKSPGNPTNYTCNEDEHNYYVCIDNNGRLEGYAWSAGADSVSIDGNPGLGWIKFSKQFVGLAEAGGGGVIPYRSDFCTTLLDSNKIGCANDENFTGEFKFKAYPVKSNYTYKWDCDGGTTTGNDDQDTVVCKYSGIGSYTPTLKVNGKNCINQAAVTVSNKSNCSVSVSENDTGTTVDGAGSKSVSIVEGQSVEARINRQCLEGGKIMWTVGAKTFEDEEIINIEPAGTASVRVAAKIVKDNKTYNCGSADVKVTEIIKWR